MSGGDGEKRTPRARARRERKERKGKSSRNEVHRADAVIIRESVWSRARILLREVVEQPFKHPHRARRGVVPRVTQPRRPVATREIRAHGVVRARQRQRRRRPRARHSPSVSSLANLWVKRSVSRTSYRLNVEREVRVKSDDGESP